MNNEDKFLGTEYCQIIQSLEEIPSKFAIKMEEPNANFLCNLFENSVIENGQIDLLNDYKDKKIIAIDKWDNKKRHENARNDGARFELTISDCEMKYANEKCDRFIYDCFLYFILSKHSRFVETDDNSKIIFQRVNFDGILSDSWLHHNLIYDFVTYLYDAYMTKCLKIQLFMKKGEL